MKLPKLFYTPGLISLLALPLLIMYLVSPFGEELYAIKMIVPSDEKPEVASFRYTKYGVWDAIKNKKIIQVQFFRAPISRLNEYTRDMKLEFVRQEIERLTFTHDTNSVLKVELGKGITYGEFIRILDQLAVYGVKRYALVDDSLYIFANEPEKRQEAEEE
ncbi:hypothetical protein [Paraflavitalea speifideaquila]|uniref:hypothetical protein n=1 Tax=Paraflavitalea speifideaquila TaxID=3076558 RepID=UPI0028E29ABC|nr:hypothetical protein [Paraflavitalea speifideiaquila]